METIRSTDFAAHTDELLARAAKGETFQIIMDGRPAVRISPEPDRAEARAAVAKMKEVLRGAFDGMTPADIKKMVHEGHKY